MGVDKREAHRTAGKPEEEPASTLKTESPHTPTIDRRNTRRHERVKADNRRGRWDKLEKEREWKQMATTMTNMELACRLNRINKLSNNIDSMKYELDALKAEVMEYMTSNGLARLESGGKIATLVESVRTTVDTKTLKARYSVIAAECSKTSVVKYIRVK